VLFKFAIVFYFPAKNSPTISIEIQKFQLVHSMPCRRQNLLQNILHWLFQIIFPPKARTAGKYSLRNLRMRLDPTEETECYAAERKLFSPLEFI
jgi:hypothetical protein